MNRDDIIRMAREAGIRPIDEFAGAWITYDEPIKRFAVLVAAAEREACIEDIMWHVPRSGRDTPEYQRAMKMLERIRARGQA